MKKLLGKKLNKKGFTLAELLIVVAIIAILIAIALPLFFGAMDNAEKARDDANIRSVKAAAVNEIFSRPELQMVEPDPAGLRPDTPADFWYVAAHIDKDGNITLESIIGTTWEVMGFPGNPRPSDLQPDTCEWNEGKQQYDIKCYVFSIDEDYDPVEAP